MGKHKILIIGGTRFFGVDIVNSFLKAGHRVAVLSNAEKMPKFIANPQIFRGNRRDKAFLKRIANQNRFDFIIDNIASTGKDVKDCLSIFRGKFNHYILTSTAWVYKTLKPFARPFREEDLKTTHFKEQQRRNIQKITLNYIKGKIACEKALVSQAKVKYTIFRPCMVVGQKDHNLRAYFYFQRLMDHGKIILFKEANQFQLVYKEDVAKIYREAIGSPESINQIFNLAPAETISPKKFVELSAKAFKTKPKFCILPKKKVALVIPNYLENEPFNFESDLYDSAKIKQKLKVSFTPYEKWIKNIAIWYRDKYFGEGSLGYNKRDKEINLCS